MECLDCIAWFILGLVLLPVILQGVGMFGSEWAPDVTCHSDTKPTCCDWITSSSYHRNFSSDGCSGPFGLQELDPVAYNIEAVSFSILMLPIGCFILEIFCNKDEETGCWGLIGGFCFMLYPLAGLLSFIGCMVVAGKFPRHTRGSSFYECLGSGLYVLIVTGLGFFYVCCKRKNKRRAPPTTGAVQVYDQGGAAAPYGPGPVSVSAVSAQAITLEERVAVHDPETGGVVEFFRSINIFHMVSHHVETE